MSKEIILRQEDTQQIINIIPNAYTTNTISHDKCIEVGAALLKEVENSGMTDKLDADIAVYLDKTKRTIAKMKDARSPVTKLFDEIRSVFTSMENDLNPSGKGTTPYKLQQLRDMYAAKKLEEEQRKRQELINRQLAEQAKNNYIVAVENYIIGHYQDLTHEATNKVEELFSTITLDNFDTRSREIDNIINIYEVPPTFDLSIINRPTNVSDEDCNKIVDNAIDQYAYLHKDMLSNIKDLVQHIKDLLPSKRKELEIHHGGTIGKVDSEVFDTYKEHLNVLSEVAKAETTQRIKNALMDDLFNSANNSAPTTSVKATVKLRINPLNTEAFPEIISMWWNREGCTLSVDELSKIFKKQITFCEKLATSGEQIHSEHIEYIEEVKAK